MNTQKKSRKRQAHFTPDEQTFHLLFDGHSAVMLLIEPETGAILDANQAAVNFYGYPKPKLCGMSIQEINTLPPEQVAAERQKALVEKRNYFIFPHRLASGEERIVEVHSSPIAFGEKRVLFSIIHDITRRKRAETALKKSEARYRTVTQSANEAIVTADSAGNIIEWNRSAQTIFGYSEDELLGQPLTALMPARFREAHQAGIRRAQTGEKKQAGKTVEMMGRRKDGSEFPLEYSLSEWQDSDGQFYPAIIRDITERKQAEDALRGEEDLLKQMVIFAEELLKTGAERVTYQKILENLLYISKAKYGALTLLNDDTGKFTTVAIAGVKNSVKNVAKMLGFEMVGKEWNEYSVENEQLAGQVVSRFSSLSELAGRVIPEMISRPLEKMLDMGELIVTKIIVNHKMIGDFTLSMPAGKRFENDTLVEIYSRQIDMFITRIKADEALRESEERYRRVVENINDALIIDSVNGSITYANDKFLRLFGFERSDLQKITLEDYVAPKWRATLREQHNRRMRGEAISTQFTYEGIRTNGKSLWLEVDVVPLFDNAGTIIGTQSAIRDITEHKRIEHELQAQRDFATQIINNMGQGLTVTDAEGRFEFVNPAYARLFGYEAADLLGTHPEDVTTPEHQDILKQQRQARIAGKTTAYETDLRRADGSIASVLITGVPRKRDGQYIGAIAVITDLTEQKRVETELRRAKNELERANQHLGQALLREQKLARTDALTGLNNRGYLFELAAREFEVAVRYQKPLSVMMFDIDNFKQINDIFGHPMGDQALIRASQTICAILRAPDIIGRYGGDEFSILLPHTSAQDALSLAGRIHAQLAATRIETEKGPFTLTISLGIAQTIYGVTSPPDTVEDLFLRADKALYAAKQAGKNRSVVFKSKEL